MLLEANVALTGRRVVDAPKAVSATRALPRVHYFGFTSLRGGGVNCTSERMICSNSC